MSALLVANGIDKAFGAVQSLADVSFSMEEGRTVGLIGPNGAGKSTFINVVSGAYPQDGGRVAFAGRSVDRLSTAERARRGLVRTFQRPTPIFTLSCLEGVTIGGFARGLSMRAARDEAASILARLGLAAFAGHSPSTLSTGQLKLLDFARVLMLQPRLVLLDELMSGLSKDEAEIAQSAVEHLAAEGTTFLLVEHLMDVIQRLSRRLVVMDAGAIVADGDPELVMREPRVIEAYLGDDAETSHA